MSLNNKRVKTLKNSMKPDINSIANKVDPYQLASRSQKPADQDQHCFAQNMRVHHNYNVMNMKYNVV